MEHRVFPHITKALQEVILKSHGMIKKLIDRTSTEKCIKVYSKIINKQYETGRKCASDFKKT